MDAEVMRQVQNFCLMDDIFFNVFMKDNIEGMEYVLRIVMDRDDLVVKEIQTQYDIPGIIARGVRFDVFCTDAEGREYDFEVQRDDEGASPRRVHYYNCMLAYRHMQRGAGWDELPSTCVIMFTEHDTRRKNKPLQRYRYRDDDADELGDGTEIIYVNGAYSDLTTALGRLISDFHCANPDEMHSEVLARRARFLKSDGKEAANMTSWVEEYAEKRAKEREKLAVFKASLANVKLLMTKLNLSAEKALDILEIPQADFPKYLAAL